MVNKRQKGFYERFVKRFFDIVLSAAALVLLSPLACLCMLAIKIDDWGASVLFTQQRNGKHGKVFRVVKFRTMKREMSGGYLLPTQDTLTGIGRILRKFSLDEIPQFVSIFVGKMSLIGPRPLLLEYYDWFSPTERRRFDVRPGLTGLSQINGRANLNWDERFGLDVAYVDNLSLLLDLKILIKTFGVIFSHKNVMPEDGAQLVSFDIYRKQQLKTASSPGVQTMAEPGVCVSESMEI